MRVDTYHLHDIVDISSLTCQALAHNKSSTLYIWQHIGCCTQAKIIPNQAAPHCSFQLLYIQQLQFWGTEGMSVDL